MEEGPGCAAEQPCACSRLSRERTAAAGSPLTPHLAVFPLSKEVQLAWSNFSPEFIFYSGVKFNQTVKYLPTAGTCSSYC